MIRHMAFIMDGNRRWAEKRGMLRVLGHKEGMNTIQMVLRFCLKKEIRHVSLYAFSLENFKRSEHEKSYLFSMIEKQAESILKECIQNKIKVCFVGDKTLFPKNVVPVFEKIESETRHYNNLRVNFLFCYGARQEIVSGVKRIAKKIKSGQLSENDITEEIFKQHLWTNGTPEPDLIVRTGGHKRLSNFLLYQAAYSEFSFLDCMWPELTERDLQDVVVNYHNRKRKFGV